MTLKLTSTTILIVIVLVAVGVWGLFPNHEKELPTHTSVLIIGAGAAGLSAGFELEKQGVDYTIIEASDTYGGRMKESVDFTDFPIDLGAEWIHEDPQILNRMAGQEVLEDIAISTYNPRELLVAIDGELQDYSFELEGYQEWKFTNSTWFNFFTTYLVPEVEKNIIYNQPINSITYDNDSVNLTTSTNDTYTADYLIVTVPVSVLQNEYITFAPPFPDQQLAAINNIKMAPGLKLFIAFEDQFYPEMLYLEEPDPERPYEEKLFYDATFDKDTQSHVMGVLINGQYSEPYVNLDDQTIVDRLLSELDGPFNGQASDLYQDHIVQNWSQEPFIQGTYTTDTAGLYWKTLADASAPLADRIYFAGAAYSAEMQGTVAGAWRSANKAIEDIVNTHGE